MTITLFIAPLFNARAFESDHIRMRDHAHNGHLAVEVFESEGKRGLAEHFDRHIVMIVLARVHLGECTCSQQLAALQLRLFDLFADLQLALARKFEQGGQCSLFAEQCFELICKDEMTGVKQQSPHKSRVTYRCSRD